jgi:hypothetical protein
MNDTNVLLDIHWNRETSTSGIIPILTQKDEMGNVKKNEYIDFTSTFLDMTCLEVYNCSLLGHYPKRPYKESYRYPKVKDAATLYKATVAFKQQTDKPPYPIKTSDELIQHIVKMDKREADFLAELGYCSFEEENRSRALTLKGAFILTFKNLFPIVQIRRILDHRRCMKALKEAGCTLD